jgi:hypothetical protein
VAVALADLGNYGEDIGAVVEVAGIDVAFATKGLDGGYCGVGIWAGGFSYEEDYVCAGRGSVELSCQF